MLNYLDPFEDNDEPLNSKNDSKQIFGLSYLKIFKKIFKIFYIF